MATLETTVILKLRDITEQEWNEYKWVEVTTFGDLDKVYIRGIRLTQPPQDGYHYEECTQLGDTEQQWRRVKTWTKLIFSFTETQPQKCRAA